MRRLKEIAGTMVFLGIGMGLFVLVSYLLRPVDDDFFRQQVTGFYAEEDNSLDIVTLGSSSIYAYFNNPYLWKQYGLTSYNLATPGQSVFLLEELMDEVNKSQSPQLYIVETRKMTFVNKPSANEERFPMVYNNMKYSWNRLKLINTLLPTWQERLQAYFDVATYHDSWEEFSLENIQYYDNERKHELKGWRTISSVVPIEKPVIHKKVKKRAISKAAEEALISFLEKCKRENLQVLFLATPWEIVKEYQRKNAYIGEIIESYGFQFLDCNLYMDEIGLDFEQDFYNRRHTNLLGSEKVTDFVGNYILEHYDLDIDHSTAVENDWNNTLGIYDERAEIMRTEMQNTQ